METPAHDTTSATILDESGLDPDTLASVDAKVSAITEAHGGPHDDEDEAGGRR